MRFLKTITVSALALAAAASAPSAVRAATPAANARLDESVRCFAVTSILSISDDEETKQVGQMGALYFMGRLEGQLSDKEFEDRLFEFSKNRDKIDTNKILAGCGELMQAHGAAVQAIGDRVSKREEAAGLGK